MDRVTPVKKNKMEMFCTTPQPQWVGVLAQDP